jgi:outer membrane protein TolC
MNRLLVGPAWCAAAGAVLCAGCASPFDHIDRNVEQLLANTSQDMRADVWPQPFQFEKTAAAANSDIAASLSRETSTSERLPTVNPRSDELAFTPAADAGDVLDRLLGYGAVEGDVLTLDLKAAMSLAVSQAPEYRRAEEDYVLTALRLLIERHLWGPRLFDELTAEAIAEGDDGTYDSSLRLVNELRATQRLPYGGEVSARFLARATEDLHERVAGENVQDAEVILGADIPLLRGAGMAAREDRIQAERDMIYAARDFEDFRRGFIFDIAEDFLNLVVQQQSIENARRQVESFEQLELRERRLVQEGRQDAFQAALAAQDTLFARDRLNGLVESFRLAVDRFKVRLGIPESQPVRIAVDSTLDLPVPQTDLDHAVTLAMMYRLDLQNRRDQLGDAQRGVEVARNNVLADLDVFGEARIGTDDQVDRGGLRFNTDDADFRGGITFGLPLDREIERLQVRQSQVQLERAIRDYEQFRDEVAVDVRAAVRGIDRALFSLQLQDENVRIAERRQASLDADPDRATARDRSDAVEAMLEARDERDAAARDLQVAILEYLLETGQLRINPDGSIPPL